MEEGNKSHDQPSPSRVRPSSRKKKKRKKSKQHQRDDLETPDGVRNQLENFIAFVFTVECVHSKYRTPLNNFSGSYVSAHCSVVLIHF